MYNAWKVSNFHNAPTCFRTKTHPQACAVGRSSKTVREFLEKNHEDNMSKEQTIKLAIKSLLEVVQTGAKST